MFKQPWKQRGAARAFSLIEVLMAVLILALGLLGLGAIMPAVVRQQRVGADQVYGTLAGRSAVAFIEGTSRLNAIHPSTTVTDANYRRLPLLKAWAKSLSASEGGAYANGWCVPTDGSWVVLPVDSTNWFTNIGPPLAGGAPSLERIELADRLYPGMSAGVDEPQFVFDLAVRRASPVDVSDIAGGIIRRERPGNFSLQFAIITRRVDQRVRVPLNLSGVNQGLYKAMLDVTRPTQDRRLPIAEDNNGNALQSGEYGGGSNGRYSLPYLVDVTFDPNVPDQLIIDAAQDSNLYDGTNFQGTQRQRDLAALQVAQVGQTIVDNLGNVYTVQGVDERFGVGSPNYAVRISPAVTRGVGASSDTANPSRLHQILVSPQPPAAVNIITVNP